MNNLNSLYDILIYNLLIEKKSIYNLTNDFITGFYSIILRVLINRNFSLFSFINIRVYN